MNSYQRVIHAITHEPGSPVARGELVIDRGFSRAYLNWRMNDPAADVLTDTSLLLACCRFLKLDLVCVPADSEAGQASILSPPAEDIDQFADEGLFVFWLVDGAFQSAMTDLGMTALMTAMARAPADFVQDLQQRCQTVMATMVRGVGAGVHGVIIAEDIAYGQGTYMSPDFIEHYLLPVWQAQVEAAHGLGVPVFFHSDGNVRAVLPHIVEAGFDGLQCIEPAAGMDMNAIQAQYGERLCLMGNIDPALLCGPDPSGQAASDRGGLKRAVKHVTALGGRGGLIFGTCSGLHTGMLPERVHYMYQLAAQSDMDPSGAPS